MRKSRKTKAGLKNLVQRVGAALIGLLVGLGAMGFGALPAAQSVWAAETPSIEMSFTEEQTVGGAAQRHLALTVKNATFMSLQLQLQYDPAVLVPSNRTSNEAVSNIIASITPTEPMYNSASGTGWVSLTGNSLSTQDGVMGLTIFVDENSDQASGEEGFITADEEGLEILSFSFRIEGELKDDSLQLYGSAGVPTGVMLVRKNETMVNDLEGLTNGSMVTINGVGQPDTGDEYNSGVPKDETEGNENETGGNPGGIIRPGGGTNDNNSNNNSSQGSGGTTGQTGGSATEGTGAATDGSGAAASTVLSDISGHWAQSAIQTLTDRGVTGGYPDGTFRPEAGLSRGEFAQFLYKGLRLPLPEHPSLPFTDTKGHWAELAVAGVYYGGFTSGTGAKTFGVEDFISREQLVTILCKAKGIEPLENPAGQLFTDDAAISDWSRGYVYAARENKLLSGYEDGSFRPQAGMTRGEMAWVVSQILPQ